MTQGSRGVSRLGHAFVAMLTLAASATTSVAWADTVGNNRSAPSSVSSAAARVNSVDPMASEPRSGDFVCHNPYGPWSYVSNVPSGYVIGNCDEGWKMSRSSFFANTYNWDGGYFDGNFRGCGWIRADWDTETDANATTTACANASRNPSEFMAYANCKSPCGDGTDTQTLSYSQCWLYANYRPWSSTPAESDPIRYLGPNHPLRWRYVTKDGTHAMVHDIGAGAGEGNGNWGFVYLPCLTGLPGSHVPPSQL